MNLRALGTSLISQPDIQKHKTQRAHLNPFFHKSILNNHVEKFNENGNLLIENLRKSADGKSVVYLQDVLNRLLLDVIATVNIKKALKYKIKYCINNDNDV